MREANRRANRTHTRVGGNGDRYYGDSRFSLFVYEIRAESIRRVRDAARRSPFFRFTKKFRGLGHAVGSRFTEPFVRDYECSPPPDDDAPCISLRIPLCVRARAPRHKTRERYRTYERRHRVRERSVQSAIRRGETVRQALAYLLSSLLL